MDVGPVGSDRQGSVASKLRWRRSHFDDRGVDMTAFKEAASIAAVSTGSAVFVGFALAMLVMAMAG